MNVNLKFYQQQIDFEESYNGNDVELWESFENVKAYSSSWFCIWIFISIQRYQKDISAISKYNTTKKGACTLECENRFQISI